MDRRTFIQNACLACLSATAMPALLASCSTSRHIMGTIDGDDLVVPVSSFVDAQGKARPSIVVSNGQLKHPIALFKNGADGYHATLMRCTHRGAELQVVGERLECPAHGSVFASTGAVIEGPASSSLRIMPVTEREGNIHISLKA